MSMARCLVHISLLVRSLLLLSHHFAFICVKFNFSFIVVDLSVVLSGPTSPGLTLLFLPRLSHYLQFIYLFPYLCPFALSFPRPEESELDLGRPVKRFPLAVAPLVRSVFPSLLFPTPSLLSRLSFEIII